MMIGMFLTGQHVVAGLEVGKCRMVSCGNHLKGRMVIEPLEKIGNILDTSISFGIYFALKTKSILEMIMVMIN